MNLSEPPFSGCIAQALYVLEADLVVAPSVRENPVRFGLRALQVVGLEPVVGAVDEPHGGDNGGNNGAEDRGERAKNLGECEEAC